MEMLVNGGLYDFSMQKLARAAGVSPATLYIHFVDKEDLLFQVWAEQAEALSTALLEGFDPRGPFAEGLWIQWRNRIRFFRENPMGWRLLDQVRHSPLHAKYFLSQPAFLEAMGTFVQTAIDRGEIHAFGTREEGAEAFPRGVFWSLAYAPLYEMLMMESSHPAHGPDVFRLDDRIIQTAFDCVLRGLRP
jgi:AcrR family transcriptional regulator